MSARIAVEYCLNAVWLVPLVASAAWLAFRIGRPTARVEHLGWLAALAVCVVLPAVGIDGVNWDSPETRSAVVETTSPRKVALAPIGSPVGEQTGKPVAGRASLPKILAIGPWELREFALVYPSILGIALCRIAWGCWLAARLIRASRVCALSHDDAAFWHGLTASLKIAPPRIRVSELAPGPVAVGILRPTILLPPGFSDLSAIERRAVLCHELAHVKRRDCLVHLMVQAVGLPLFWHPALHAIARRIARTREMVCDEMAAGELLRESPAAAVEYARCLVQLATTLSGKGAFADAGVGLFRSNQLEERVMRLTEVKRKMGLKQMWMRRVGGGALAGMALTVGTAIHVRTALAQTPAAIPAAPPAPTDAPPAPVERAPGSSSADGKSTGPGSSGTLIEHVGGTHVLVEDGSQIHRWTGADGESYELRNGQAAPLTAEQKRAAEAEFHQRLQQAQDALDRVNMKIGSPEFKAQIDRLSSVESDAAIAKMQADIDAQLAKLNSKEFKAQMEQATQAAAQVNTPEFRKQMADLKKQMKLLDSSVLESRMDAASKRLDEASARLDAAAKALDEAQKRLAQTQPK